MNVKVRSLKAFMAVAESGSITQAADRLGMAQPSLTASIKDLERTLGVTLFDRTTRSVHLTDAGREFLARIERPVADLEEAYRQMLDLSEARRGTVVIGTLPSSALTLVPLVMRELKAGRPSLQARIVEAHNAQLIEMLRTNQVEFAVATRLDRSADLDFVPLLADTFMLIHPPAHRVSEFRRPGWINLVPYDLILLSQGSNARAQFELAVRGSTVQPGMRFDVTHMVTAVHMVRQGLGITIVPRLALPGLHLEGLAARPLAGRLSTRRIGILHRRSRSLSAGARHLMEIFRRVASTMETTATEP